MSGKPPVPPELDRIADVVLNYKPKPKSKAAKRRARKLKRAAKRSTVVMYITPHV